MTKRLEIVDRKERGGVSRGYRDRERESESERKEERERERERDRENERV